MASVTRRSFISGVLASAGTAAARPCGGAQEGAGAAPAGAPAEAPELVFGILSDVHIYGKGKDDTFRDALAYFRDNGADAVVVAGDIADGGEIYQFEIFAKAWFDVFPGDRAPDGRKVERLFVYGNHDAIGWTWGGKDRWKDEDDKRARALGFDDNRARVWERLFGEPYAPVWAKTVKGYVFTGAHWGEEKKLDAFLRENEARLGLAGARPFFHVQHPHPFDTVQGPWAWGNDEGAATRALERFPNAVAISGHSHYSLTDERTIWQGAFTSVGTASLRYVFSQYARENGNEFGGKTFQMPRLPQDKARQGMLAKVYRDRIVFSRREFVYGKSLGADWTVPLDGTRPYAFAPRREAAVAPEFARGAEVAVERRTGKDRKGRETDQFAVSFPAARPSATSRVHDYEVAALVTVKEDVEVPVAVKRVHAESYFFPPDMEAEKGEIVFAVSELKDAKMVRFAVRPMECFGGKGREIYSGPVSVAG